jgi:hypothetical protein
MNEQEEKQINQLYANGMEEIKRRVKAIQIILNKESTTRTRQTDAEYLCLQFRKILELIALSNLVSNKEEYSNRYDKFASHWNGKRIIADIEKINPKFYPVPVDIIWDAETKTIAFGDVHTGFLTKDDYIMIYDECAELLHAENPFGQPKDIEKFESNFPLWLSKIMRLLNHHLVHYYTIEKFLLVAMTHPDMGGNVLVSAYTPKPD